MASGSDFDPGLQGFESWKDWRRSVHVAEVGPAAVVLKVEGFVALGELAAVEPREVNS